MDALKIDKAHVVGHSMGAYTALHVGIHHPQRCLSVTAAGCGWGSTPDAEEARGDEGARRRDRQDVRRRGHRGGGREICRRADAPDATSTRIRAALPSSPACSPSIRRRATRSPCSICSSSGRRCGRWKPSSRHSRVPLLVVVGDEDELCLDGSVFLKRTVPTAGLLVHPAHRPHRHQRGAGRVQRRARRPVRRGRSRPLAVAPAAILKSNAEEHRDGSQAQGQDRAGHRRQRRHRQGHRAARSPRKASTSRSARAARSRSRPTAAEIAKETGRKIVAIPADLRKDADAKNFIEQAPQGARPRRHHGQQCRLGGRRRDRASDRRRLGEGAAAQVHGLCALPALRAADHGQAGRRPRGEPDRQ